MNTRSLLFRFTVVLAFVAMPLAAFAANVGKAYGVGSSIEWQLEVRGQSAVRLTVIAPDGTEYVSTSKSGNPSFNLSKLGSDLQDGVYHYELVVEPNVSNDVAKKLEAARATGDAAAARKIMKAAGLETISQSGAFSVSNGSIVDPNAKEADANDSAVATRNLGVTTNAVRPGNVQADDQVIPDDLIVQGSICAGFDCVNNESFGFDTIRMKENNTRVKFEDTSVGSFPTNDWQLTANDSASGGASKFSIEDITGAKVPFTVTAGASTNSIFVDSTGRVGFRTSTPVLDLHVATSNTPAIRLEQNNTGGFTAQTWDIAGNEANFFVRDVTSGSRLPFRIRPGAPTSSLDIAADGDVGIGTASPEAKLHVFGASNADTFVGIGNDPDGSTGTESALTFGYSGSSFGRASAFFNVRPDSGAAAPNPSLRFATGNSVRMLIDNEGFIGLGDTASAGTNPTSPIQYTNGAVTARLTAAGVWQDNSSRAAKEHIVGLDADAAFKALEALQPVTYNYKVMPEDPKVGFIAEDVPELVATPEREGLSALDIVAVVTKVVQEQQKTIEALNARIAQLEKEKKN
ncbi:MAG TPA: tail fiber domain-containing protein [Thermoanaerobaculia bacterium]|nr:tail fiber domain-containing protein [Thermoanaerobaculia bacterium]